MQKKKVILGIGAHADDMDFGASATFAKFIQDDWDGYYIVATDGSRGSKDPTMTHEKLAAIRQKEQRAAAEVVGLTDVFFLGHTDTQLAADMTLKEELVRLIRKLQPAIVVTMDPTFFYYAGENFGFVNHTDHRTIGLATLDSIFPLARDRLSFPEHEESGVLPWRVEELWLVSFVEKRHVVDVSSTWEKKMQALQSHASQFDDFDVVRKRLTERTKTFGKEKGYMYAENFIRLLLPA